MCFYVFTNKAVYQQCLCPVMLWVKPPDQMRLCNYHKDTGCDFAMTLTLTRQSHHLSTRHNLHVDLEGESSRHSWCSTHVPTPPPPPGVLPTFQPSVPAFLGHRDFSSIFHHVAGQKCLLGTALTMTGWTLCANTPAPSGRVMFHTVFQGSPAGLSPVAHRDRWTDDIPTVGCVLFLISLHSLQSFLRSLPESTFLSASRRTQTRNRIIIT